MAIARALETIPGTEVLLYSDGNISQHSVTADKLVLVPEPSNDPDDPLVSLILLSCCPALTDLTSQNWNPLWKSIVIINQAIFVFISVLTPLSIAPLTPIFVQEFHKTIPQVNMLVCVLSTSNLMKADPANSLEQPPWFWDMRTSS